MLLLLVLLSTQAHAWGTRGHEMTVRMAATLVGEKTLSNCHLTVAQLEEHVTDPDLKWRRDSRRHPDEAQAHFFHVDKQPADWKTRADASDRSQGYLVYRILSWIEQAKADLTAGRQGELQEHLFGIAHYLGDLTMPLHLSSRHDGSEVGLPDLHAQWESKMVHRFEKDLASRVEARLRREKIPALWAKLSFHDLVMTVAEQSAGKVDGFFAAARPALTMPNQSPRRKKSQHRKGAAGPRFNKPLLFKQTGDLAADQLALAARLIAHALNQVCH
jgi:hypothetical protein